MARKTARVDRECLACGAHFEGTPKATRCPTCRAEGRKVPSDKQAARARIKSCSACGERKPIEAYQNHDRLCDSCFEDLQFSPLSAEEEARLREEARKQRVKDRLARQAEWLDRREKPPKGHRKMTKTTAKLPIGLYWLQIVAADGAAHSLAYLGDSTDLSEEDRLKLLMTYLRLRVVKRHHPQALTKLCPIALLKDETQAAITDLPVVEEPSDGAEDHDWPLEVEPGSCLTREIAEIADQRDRRDLQVRLGLVAASE